MGTQIRLGLVFPFISILSSYRYPKFYQFFWEFWGKEERVLHFYGHLCSIWIHWNKTRQFTCLEDVTEHLPLNLRNLLFMFILSPYSGYLQELFHVLKFPSHTMSLVLCTHFFSLSGARDMLPFSTQSSLSTLLVVFIPFKLTESPERVENQVLDYRRVSSQKGPSNQLVKLFKKEIEKHQVIPMS